VNTKTITLTLSGARPNNLPDVLIDDKRSYSVKCGQVVGSGTLSALTITADPDELTIGSASITSPNATVLITHTTAGEYELSIKATLADGQIYKGLVNLNVIDPANSTDDY
jgi:hypothetical protein